MGVKTSGCARHKVFNAIGFNLYSQDNSVGSEAENPNHYELYSFASLLYDLL